MSSHITLVHFPHLHYKFFHPPFVINYTTITSLIIIPVQLLLNLIASIDHGKMEFNNPLTSDASYPIKSQHVEPSTNHHLGNVIAILCECGVPAEFIVDLDIPNIRCSICHEVYHDKLICFPNVIIL